MVKKTIEKTQTKKLITMHLMIDRSVLTETQVIFHFQVCLH